MIVQALLDLVGSIMANIINSIPPLAPEVSEALAQVTGSAGYVAALVAKMGIVVPWAQIGAAVSIWVSVLGFWATVLGVRFVVWVFGR